MNQVNIYRLLRKLDYYYRQQDVNALATVEYPEEIEYKSNEEYTRLIEEVITENNTLNFIT